MFSSEIKTLDLQLKVTANLKNVKEKILKYKTKVSTTNFIFPDETKTVMFKTDVSIQVVNTSFVTVSLEVYSSASYFQHLVLSTTVTSCSLSMATGEATQLRYILGGAQCRGIVHVLF